MCKFKNRNNKSSQLGGNTAVSGYGSTTVTQVAGSINTANNSYIIFTAQKVLGSESFVLEEYYVFLYLPSIG
jgi:hypothetical protein